MKAEEYPHPWGLDFQVDSFSGVIISQRALGKSLASATNVLSMYLFILHFTSKALVSREERRKEPRMWGLGEPQRAPTAVITFYIRRNKSAEAKGIAKATG